MNRIKLDSDVVTATPYTNKFDKSKNLVQGDTLTLRCDTFGYPSPQVTWYRDDEPLRPEDDERVAFDVYECECSRSERASDGGV